MMGIPASSDPRMFIVITDFNGYNQTRHCLQALRASRYRNFDILVIDHGTSGETRERLREEFSQVIRLEGKPDLWWAGATNLGVRYALAQGAKRVVLLNNDCYVQPDTIETLVRHADKHPQAIIAPVQRDLRTQRMAPIRLRSLFLLGFPTIHACDLNAERKIKKGLVEVELIAGGRGALIPSSVFDIVGLFDEVSLPHYYSDHDFYLRARKAGISLYIATTAIADVDGTHTTLAANPGLLRISEFLHSLKDQRSHRNIFALNALFKKHHPVSSFYTTGVVINIARYLLSYLLNRYWLVCTRSERITYGTPRRDHPHMTDLY